MDRITLDRFLLKGEYLNHLRSGCGLQQSSIHRLQQALHREAEILGWSITPIFNQSIKFARMRWL